MKFLKLSSYLIASLMLLSACGQEIPTEQDIAPVTEKQTEKTETASKKSDSKKKDDNEVSDGPLTEIGQWAKENDGTKVTLKKIAIVDKTLDMNPMKLTLHEVKVLERKGGNNDGNVIQITYTSENTSDKDIMFHPIKVITTNTKQQIDVFTENVSGNSGGGEFYGEVVKEGFIIVPYPEEDLTNLENLKLITGSVWNNDQPEEYFEEVTEEIFFN